MPASLEVIDSHTGGEPTRTVVGGLPELGAGTVAEQLERMRAEFDWVRSAVGNEPRGSDAMVGAAVVPTSEDDCDIGVIFFNNVGYLKMCVHGTIGVAVTMANQGKLGVGESLPRILACRQVSPSANFPAACRQANFALVPVPQGERS